MTPITALAIPPGALVVWTALTLGALIVAIRDMMRHNRHLVPARKVVWGLGVAATGPLGLLVYWLSGRAQNPDDVEWRRALRALVPAVAGFGPGVVMGAWLARDVLGWGPIATVLTGAGLALGIGCALSLWARLQEGAGAMTALRGSLRTVAPAIVALQIVAIVMDLLLGAQAAAGAPAASGSWLPLLTSLPLGLLVAYPGARAAVRAGGDAGMRDPRQRHPEDGSPAEGQVHPGFHPGHA